MNTVHGGPREGVGLETKRESLSWILITLYCYCLCFVRTASNLPQSPSYPGPGTGGHSSRGGIKCSQSQSWGQDQLNSIFGREGNGSKKLQAWSERPLTS